MRVNFWKPLALALGVALGIVIGRGSVSHANAEQAHMQNALWLLGDARNALASAEADKAGHRIKAMQMVDSAIVETREGIAAGAR